MGDPARSDPTGHAHRHAHGGHTKPHGKELAWISLGALGVVYGDIGTSPLYAMRECFAVTNPHHVDPSAGGQILDVNILGVLSLVFWSR